MICPHILLAIAAVTAVAPSAIGQSAAAAGPTEIKLFNGQDLGGWTFHLADKSAKMEDVWSVADGVLTCKGKPVGYLRTKKDYANYVLRLEWRFDPAKGPGNSGVLIRLVGPDKVWPKSIEAQLESKNAGDIWNIDKFPMKVDAARTKGRRTTKLKPTNERPLGQWNQYEIVVDHGTITLKVNGEVQNVATECEEVPGKIGLQSEGAEIQFRNIRLTPIE
jgi:3-keto-disaccharide hydrolase